MRAGDELVPMSEDRLRAIFAEGQPDWLSQPAMTDCDDDKVVQVLDTQSYFDLLHLPYPANRTGVLERLQHEKLIVCDKGKVGRLRTWAGCCLLSGWMPLTGWRARRRE